jgi:hypothetical protein
VHEIGVPDLGLRLVQEGARLHPGEPRLALLDFFFRKGQLERAAVLGVVAPDEPLAVGVDAGEVGLGLLLGRGPETLKGREREREIWKRKRKKKRVSFFLRSKNVKKSRKN